MISFSALELSNLLKFSFFVLSITKHVQVFIKVNANDLIRFNTIIEVDDFRVNEMCNSVQNFSRARATLTKFSESFLWARRTLLKFRKEAGERDNDQTSIDSM